MIKKKKTTIKVMTLIKDIKKINVISLKNHLANRRVKSIVIPERKGSNNSNL